MSIAQNFPNIKPSLMLSFADTRQLDSRVTFTRSTPACHYDGKTTAMAEQNLLLQSQTFTTSPWGSFQASVTANTTTAPDGTITASTITATGVVNPVVFQSKPISTTGVISIYLKKGTSDFGYLYVDSPSLTPCFFNLNTGVVGSFSAPFTSISIVAVGNGWYRCVAVFSGISGTNLGFGVCDSSSATTCTIGNTIFAWGAQLEQRSSATAYTVTTTQPITNYIPVLLTAGGNQARFDCNPTTGESLGLLIEEQRTNLVFRSVYAGVNWTGYGATLTQNYTIAPDASQTACQIFSTGFQTTRIDTGSLTGGTTYAASIWMKSNTSSNQTIALQVGDNLAINCTVTPQWQRFTGAVPPTGSGYDFIDLEGTANDISVWGAQLEQASFATSYIPTTGAAATRTADAASMTGTNFSSWYNQGEGTLYCETSVLAISTSPRTIWSLYNSSNEMMRYWIWDGANTTPRFTVLNGGATQAELTSTTITANTAFRNASGYKVNDFGFSLNGGTTSTDTSGYVPNPFTSLFIGQQTTGFQYLNGYIKKIAYYPLKVTSTNLQALTS
jgi:hypothetical protein